MFVDKYRPQKLEDVVLDSDLKSMFYDFINKKTINNFLFSGKAGIGKTTLAKVLVNELDAILLYINCGVDNGVDMIRSKVKDFCDAVSIDNRLKIVVLDEADAISSNSGTGSSGQSALRNIIEESSSDTRFILTCNYLNKIIEPIQSRCTPVNVKFSLNDILVKILNILKLENVKCSKQVIEAFQLNIINKKYPDIRSILNNLEHWIKDGVLTDQSNAILQDTSEIVKFILTMTEPDKIREFLLRNEDKFSSNYEELAGELFDVIEDPKKQLVIAEALYRMAICLDKEIQFYAMLLEIKALKK